MIKRPTHKVYQLTVQGDLKEDWQDWFNGMLVATQLNPKINPSTTITCRVRDQAELIGIINWLHNMNMVIENVSVAPTRSEAENAQEID